MYVKPVEGIIDDFLHVILYMLRRWPSIRPRFDYVYHVFLVNNTHGPLALRV